MYAKIFLLRLIHLQQIKLSLNRLNLNVLCIQYTNLRAVSFSLFLTTPLLELHATHVHYSGGDLVYVVLLFLGETKDVEGLL